MIAGTHVRRALALLALAMLLSALATPYAFAQVDMQDTLDNTTPDAPGEIAGREWTPEWPHHPSQAEIDDAIARIPEEHAVWSANEMGEWTETRPLTVSSATPYKAHSLSGGPDLGGDPATGDHLFIYYEGTLNVGGLASDLYNQVPEDPSDPTALPD